MLMHSYNNSIPVILVGMKEKAMVNILNTLIDKELKNDTKINNKS